MLESLVAGIAPLWAWLKGSDLLTRVLATIAASAVVSVLASAFRVARHLRKRRRLRRSFARQIKRYRDKLENDAFHIHHSWMREDQTLDEVLVPVIVAGRSGIESLQDFFLKASTEANRSNRPIRIVVTGAPGSGKSVALRLMARLSWLSLRRLESAAPGPAVTTFLADYLRTIFKIDMESMSSVPVVMTCADYRRSGFNMEAAVMQSLSARHFNDPSVKWEYPAADFVRDRVSDGRFLLFVDGLDELRVDDRREAAQRLVAFAGAHPTISIIVGCRTIAFRELRDSITALQPAVVEMAELIPSSIREFVRRWRFESPKSDAELFAILSNRPHLRELAKNPLTLTITTFLYSLPKYRLPDNRAQFYEVCARALLEEWDQSQNAGRANQFDRPHKEQILARLAFEHLRGRDPDQDIDEYFALGLFASEMQKIGLNPGQNAQLLKEIEENAGLLVPLPPNGLRFPHQTFLEYFASLYLVRNQTVDVLIELYRSDPRRWRETLLLYSGLNTQIESTATILKTAVEAGDMDLAIEGLTSARAIPPDAATQVLDRIDALLIERPTPHLVQYVGALAANRQSAFSERALRMLTACVATSASLPDDVLQTLILTLIRHHDADVVALILEHFERLQIQRILAAMDEDSVQQIMSRLSLERLTRMQQAQVVEALRLSKMPRALYEILHASAESYLTHITAIALGRLSSEKAFWDLLNDPRRSTLRASDEIAQLLRRWAGPNISLSGDGQIVFMTIAEHLATGMFDGSASSFDAPKPDLHAWMSYLAHALAYERRYPRLTKYGDEWITKDPSNVPVMVLTPHAARAIWRNIDRVNPWFDVARSGIWSLSLPAALSFIPALLLTMEKAASGVGTMWESGVAWMWLICAISLSGATAVRCLRSGKDGLEAPLVLLFGPSLGCAALIVRASKSPAFGLTLAAIWIGVTLLSMMAASGWLLGLLLAQVVFTTIYLNSVAYVSPWWPSFNDSVSGIHHWLRSARVPD